MIPKECKRLAEVDFPIAEVSKHAAREKSGPKGHISMLHQWWARRPLASSRAVHMAMLLPDPCDEQCPDDFKQQAREILREVRQRPEGDYDLQKALLWFIGSFANWDLSSHPVYLKVARNLVRAAHPEELPLVVDPFSGGGSIPLEALRLGCETFATDLNPVAVTILKTLLVNIARSSGDTAEQLRRVGMEIGAELKAELASLYPVDSDGAIPIAYLWARTIYCESPNCGAEIPIFRSPWLHKAGVDRPKYFREDSSGESVALVQSAAPKGGPVEYRIARGQASYRKQLRYEEALGTKSPGNNANVRCPCCGGVVPGRKSDPRVPLQLSSQSGGADTQFDSDGRRIGGAQILAVVTQRVGERGRQYRLPTDADYMAVRGAQERVAKMLSEWEQGGRQGLCPVPDEPLPPIGTLGFRVQRYGMLKWGDLFTSRQKVVLVVLGNLIGRAGGSNEEIAELLACAFSRVAMSGMSCTRWNATAEKMQHTFGRQALPIVWDFAEVVPTAKAPGNWQSAYEIVADIIDTSPRSAEGQVQLADAVNSPLPDQAAAIWFTDPPYYDAVPYADLSDFFLVWLKRTLPGSPLLRDPFDPDNPLSPKTREAVQDETKVCDGRIKDREFFESTMADVFAEGRRILRDDGIGAVVFAHKTTEGWEALLSGMIRGGWTVTGSWPIATEMASRLRASNSAALKTSVHLICRPRPEEASVGDWANVLRELPLRVAARIERLQSEGIRGADLVFACIGPALEIFSRYRAVETAEGHEVGLPEYLETVWEVVGRAALEQVLGSGDVTTGALEEDARLTALFLWTIQATEACNGEGKKVEEDEDKVAKVAAKGFSLPYDVVRRFAQPMGIDLDVWTGRTIGQEKGVVRLLPVTERAEQLFGKQGARAVADWIESDPEGNVQGALFPEMGETPKKKSPGRGKKAIIGANAEIQAPDATTLDRVHAAMLLQQSGQANALRTLLKAEQGRGPEFLGLANALSALYPKGAEEKRLLDAMLLAVPK